MWLRGCNFKQKIHHCILNCGQSNFIPPLPVLNFYLESFWKESQVKHMQVKGIFEAGGRIFVI